MKRIKYSVFLLISLWITQSKSHSLKVFKSGKLEGFMSAENSSGESHVSFPLAENSSGQSQVSFPLAGNSSGESGESQVSFPPAGNSSRQSQVSFPLAENSSGQRSQSVLSFPLRRTQISADNSVRVTRDLPFSVLA